MRWRFQEGGWFTTESAVVPRGGCLIPDIVTCDGIVRADTGAFLADGMVNGLRVYQAEHVSLFTAQRETERALKRAVRLRRTGAVR